MSSDDFTMKTFAALKMKASILFFQSVILVTLAAAFSTTPGAGNGIGIDNVKPRQFIELTNPFDTNQNTIIDRLPASFIRTWPTWVLEEDGELVRIPDEETEDGFLTPSSIDELWQPVDLKRPQMKLALGFHVRSGVIRHVMPALDVSFDGSHRNRGMCSVPRAHKWMDFSSMFSDDWERFKMRLSSRKQGEREQWESLSTSKEDSLVKAVERATICLAEAAPVEMGEGSHILHVILKDADSVEAPMSSHDLRVTLIAELDDNDEGNEAGVLQVAVAATMAGSDSQYLPEAYKPLYNDETLRNPRFNEFMERKQAT
ncbi:hypothetical protein IV203_017020 [Nitzschia inconspicua]|uniref:Uncharacterized protein n=1 Tax=Nitzschia inconspicua TaxID=303405 RepID=A0A9K3KSB9_9STRA|nr:hypothetical protein IV203_017020 [Nitzschia inconspicua]